MGIVGAAIASPKLATSGASGLILSAVISLTSANPLAAGSYR
ncbi:MAG TPA: hypothetical protein VFE19_03670 [Jatrophihabitantaceae bacterium]|nr:hypothetical protein [Jatrophihabitantaceae bacterium]